MSTEEKISEAFREFFNEKWGYSVEELNLTSENIRNQKDAFLAGYLAAQKEIEEMREAISWLTEEIFLIEHQIDYIKVGEISLKFSLDKETP